MKEGILILYRKWFYFHNIYIKIYFSFNSSKLAHLFLPANFNEMSELPNPEFFLSPETTHGQLSIIRFFKEIKSIIFMTFYRLYLFFKVLLIRSLPLIFFCFFKSTELFSYYNYSIKIRSLYSLWLSAILYFVNVEDQTNFENLKTKLCIRLPKFHP